MASSRRRSKQPLEARKERGAGTAHDAPRKNEAKRVPGQAVASETGNRAFDRGVLFLVGPAAFFLLFSLYFGWVIDPRLVHHSFGILMPYRAVAFETNAAFLAKAATVGGLADYLARGASAIFASQAMGTALMLGSVVAALAITRRLCSRCGEASHFLGLVPGLLVFLAYCSYSHLLRSWLSFLAAAALFLLFRQFELSSGKRAAIGMGLFAGLYYAVGAAAFVFLLLLGIDALLGQRQPKVAAAAALAALVVPALAIRWGNVPPGEAWAGFALADPGVPLERWPTTLALFFFFPTALAANLVWGKVRPPVERPRLLYRLASTVAACAALVALASIAHDRFTRTVLQIDSYSQNEQWAEALAAAEGLPTSVYSLRCDRNIAMALHHQERLLDDWFGWLRGPVVHLLATPDQHRDGGSHFQESRVLLQLGAVNDAEKAAFEALETSGEQPALLEQLAEIETLQGRPETAAMFLRALAKQARAEPAVRPRREISPSGANLHAMPHSTAPRDTTVEGFLLRLLDANRHNRFAFDLLMGDYLSAKELDKVVRHLPRLKDAGYTKPPLCLQQAWLIHNQWQATPFPVAGMACDAQTLRRGQEFHRTVTTAGPRAAAAAYAAGYQGSYFFYYTFAAGDFGLERHER